MKKIMNQQIPAGLYQQILENMPICCIDVVLYHHQKVLLVLRKDEPEKGRWWLPGGRLYKNETLTEAVKRKIREEVGLEVEVKQKIGAYEYSSDQSSFTDIKTGTHSISINFVAVPLDVDSSEDNLDIKIDQTSSDYRWIDHIEENLDPYVKTVLEDSGVFKGNKE